MKSKLKDVYQLLEEADGNALLVLQQIVKDGKITNDFQLYVLARLLTIKNKHGEVGNLFQNIATDTSLIKDIRNWDAADLIKEVDELISWLQSFHDGAAIFSIASLKQMSNAND